MKRQALFALLPALAGLVHIASAAPALTIYNDGFAVARDTLKLSLKQGENQVSFADVTYQLEPQSVVLRALDGETNFTILEQSYRADPVSQGLLLSQFEGQEIEFERQIGDALQRFKGKVIRSGYGQAGGGEPLIEIDGQLQFGLPGTPIFPKLTSDSILKPSLGWTLQSDVAGELDAQLSYLTYGLSWQADYNVIADEGADDASVIGWVTIDNRSGKTFPEARIKLLAGDVSKVQDQIMELSPFAADAGYRMAKAAPPVEEKSFEDFHLYTLPRATTLRDQETKQVEFVRAEGVRAKMVYVYDGAFVLLGRYQGWSPEAVRQDQAFGDESNPKVWIMREIENEKANGLGMPLPKGRLRFYKQDSDGQLEFTGESQIDHTPNKETLRVQTGNAFDLTGKRTRVDFASDGFRHWVEEEFEIELSNAKKEPATIRVVEHLYRWSNWRLIEQSQAFEKVDSDTIAFEVEAPAEGKARVSYRVRYEW